MNTLRQAIHEYLALRRGLGFKLREAGNGLLDFAGFMERHHASYITEELAVAWAQQSSDVQPAHRSRHSYAVSCRRTRRLMPSESSFGSSDYSQTQLTAKVRWSSTLARLARLLTEQGYPEDSSRRHLRHHCRLSSRLKAKRTSLN